MNLLKKIIYTICAPCHPNRSATVRFAFPLVFAFAALIGTAALLDSSGSYIHLKSSTQSVKAGESFTIDVYAFAHVPVNAIDIKLRFHHPLIGAPHLLISVQDQFRQLPH